MSDASSNLLAALLGAIVGGLLALGGSVLVNTWELRRRARFRMYEELLPRVKEAWERLRWHGEQPEIFEQSMDALHRASIVLGPNESLITYHAKLDAELYVANLTLEDDPDDEEQDEGTRTLEEIAEQLDIDLERLDEKIGMQIQRMWGPKWRWWRRWLMRPRRKSAPMAEPDEPQE
jgi:hypothetical protein